MCPYIEVPRIWVYLRDVWDLSWQQHPSLGMNEYLNDADGGKAALVLTSDPVPMR